MYRGGGTGKPMAEEKGYNKAKGKAKRKIPFAPVTALEYFIYVCTFLFVAVFTIMQGVFLYKLHLYEASMEESHNPGGGGRILEGSGSTELATITSETPIGGMSNRRRIELMANASRREFSAWPPLDAIVDKEGNITGNPQFLLDFAVIGFEKCGMYHKCTQTTAFGCGYCGDGVGRSVLTLVNSFNKILNTSNVKAPTRSS